MGLDGRKAIEKFRSNPLAPLTKKELSAIEYENRDFFYKEVMKIPIHSNEYNPTSTYEQLESRRLEQVAKEKARDESPEQQQEQARLREGLNKQLVEAKRIEEQTSGLAVANQKYKDAPFAANKPGSGNVSQTQYDRATPEGKAQLDSDIASGRTKILPDAEYNSQTASGNKGYMPNEVKEDPKNNYVDPETERINKLYQEIFGRNADPSGLANFRGQTDDQIRAALNGSNEKLQVQQGQNTNQAQNESNNNLNQFQQKSDENFARLTSESRNKISSLQTSLNQKYQDAQTALERKQTALSQKLNESITKIQADTETSLHDKQQQLRDLIAKSTEQLNTNILKSQNALDVKLATLKATTESSLRADDPATLEYLKQVVDPQIKQYATDFQDVWTQQSKNLSEFLAGRGFLDSGVAAEQQRKLSENLGKQQNQINTQLRTSALEKRYTQVQGDADKEKQRLMQGQQSEESRLSDQFKTETALNTGLNTQDVKQLESGSDLQKQLALRAQEQGLTTAQNEYNANTQLANQMGTAQGNSELNQLNQKYLSDQDIANKGYTQAQNLTNATYATSSEDLARNKSNKDAADLANQYQPQEPSFLDKLGGLAGSVIKHIPVVGGAISSVGDELGLGGAKTDAATAAKKKALEDAKKNYVNA